MIWNVLDYPAIVIPVSRVDESVDAKRQRDKFYNEYDEANYNSCKSDARLD